MVSTFVCTAISQSYQELDSRWLDQRSRTQFTVWCLLTNQNFDLNSLSNLKLKKWTNMAVLVVMVVILVVKVNGQGHFLTIFCLWSHLFLTFAWHHQSHVAILILYKHWINVLITKTTLYFKSSKIKLRLKFQS